MPNDAFNYEDDDDKKGGPEGSKTTFKEFDCPSCSANNPADPPIGDGDEVLCNYCGCEFKLTVQDDGRPKFRET